MEAYLGMNSSPSVCHNTSPHLTHAPLVVNKNMIEIAWQFLKNRAFGIGLVPRL